ncbi:sulfatase [Tamlana fucoidanivorans]|uniref:sulfatase n=1 Tax=Allotamlana fucoidanivorans TaxID=2583814 RepID=UPI0013050C71|nr:sulfatase [Tamlana fucoidanivorans]
MLIIFCVFCDSNKKIKVKPNVLFIAVDDLNDWVGVMGGHELAITPNLDRLAEKGMLFTNAHSPMPVCVASRNALLSGMHPTSTGWYSLVRDHDAMVKSYSSIMSGKKMLPALFKSNGYDTYCAGKIFHKGVTDYPFLMDSLWNDVLPSYKEKLRQIDYDRGDGYGGYIFYPFPKGGSQLKNFFGNSLKTGHSLCGGPLDKEDIPQGKMYDELIADYAIDKINKKHEKPFFISAGFVRPHVPYTAPSKYFDLYNIDDIKIPETLSEEIKNIPLVGKSIIYNYGVNGKGDYQVVNELGVDYWKHLIHSYLACVTFVDDQIGRVLRALEKSEYSSNTIIVLWSDHGQSLGEKRNFRKMSLWDESSKVPLYISLPEMDEGLTCSNPVSLLDVYPTLVDLCELPEPSHLEGNSLKPLIANPSMDWNIPVLISWRYKNYAVRSKDYKYIQYRDGSQELYDMKIDPSERNNLALYENYKHIINEHKKWIPKNPRLPVGSTDWKGDEIDLTLEKWKVNDSIPTWLVE